LKELPLPLKRLVLICGTFIEGIKPPRLWGLAAYSGALALKGEEILVSPVSKESSFSSISNIKMS
jgi:hypothetical protein